LQPPFDQSDGIYKPLKLTPSSLLARELGSLIQSLTPYPIEKTQK